MCDPTFSDWRTIPGFPDYAASDEGCVRHWRKPKVLKPALDDGGYPCVMLTDTEGKRKKERVHVLVLLAYVGPRPFEGAEGCHGNGNRLDSRLSNLRWDTRLANRQDRVFHEAEGYGTKRG